MSTHRERANRPEQARDDFADGFRTAYMSVGNAAAEVSLTVVPFI